MIYGKLPVTFLSAIASEKRDSTNSRIAAYILEHLQEVQSLGIQDMAKRCSVGTASFSRFCKDVGLRDFAELKELLASEKSDFSDLGGGSGYVDDVVKSLRLVEQSVDAKALRELCVDIHSHREVAAFGLLKAGTASLSLQCDLLMLGKQVYTNVSYPQQIQYIADAGEDALVIIFSYTGSYFDYSERLPFPPGAKLPRIWMVSGKRREYPAFVGRALHFDSEHDQAGHPYQLLLAANLIARQYAEMYGE